MRVAVDMDGVLAERIPAVLDLVNERHGLGLAKAGVASWDVTVPATGKGLRDFFLETDRDPEHVRGLSPVDGAVEGMNALADDHEVLIATYRDPAAYGSSREWLREHGIPFDRLVEEPGDAKLNADAELIVDDSPRTVRAFARERSRAVLFSQPWNAGESLPEDAVRARNWDDVVGYLAPG